MEKAIPTALSEQQKECEDDERNTVLMTLVPNKEDFAALEYPQGEERIAAFLKDAKTSLESVALLGASKEEGIGLKEAIPSSSEKLAAMNREGKVNDKMCSHKEDPILLSPFSHQEPDDAIEACKVTGKAKTRQSSEMKMFGLINQSIAVNTLPLGKVKYAPQKVPPVTMECVLLHYVGYDFISDV
uniref:Uncharacterized protein n=1 Tax=Sphaerodactylus townsendi TaxID=933632 RepID=A0ACB8EKV4_9SAUR